MTALRMTWPILDPTTPLADLLGDATGDLVIAMRRNGLRQAAPVAWQIERGRCRGLRLVGEVEVAVDETHVTDAERAEARTA